MKNILLLLCILLLGEISAQSFAIGHRNVIYIDPSRNNRQIETEIYYPANIAGDNVAIAQGQFPVISFGHGFVMVWSAYQNIWSSLVPQGYIVMFPRTEGNTSPSHAEFGRDLVFLIGKMQSEGTTANSPFFGAVGATSAIMGHSMGGGSSFLAVENNTTITTMITLAAATIAKAINPEINQFLIAGHSSSEPGSRIAITHLQLQPILDLKLRLGEGTGALLAIPIIRSACQALSRMAHIADLL